MKPIRIAIVTPYSPLPVVNGGRRRIVGLATALARRGHAVKIVALCRRPKAADPTDLGAVALRYVPTLRVVIHNFLDRRRLRYRYFALLSDLPLRRLRRELEGHEIVQSELLWPFHLARRCAPKARHVLDLHDIESVVADRNLQGFFGKERQKRRVQEAEARMLREADHVLAVSRDDERRLLSTSALASRKLSLVPSGCDLLAWRRPKDVTPLRQELGIPADKDVLLFAATDQAPGRESLDALANHVLPALGPRFHVEIIGTIGEEAHRLGLASQRVRVRGVVPDPRPYFWAADVGLNPVVSGSGSNLKLIEYLAAGLRVVTTEHGARGFEDLRGLLTIEAIQGFPQAITAVLRTAAPTTEALASYDWAALAERLEAIYRRLGASG